VTLCELRLVKNTAAGQQSIQYHGQQKNA